MATEEQVLVVPRTVLESVGTFQGITFEVDRYLQAIFRPGVPRFMPRGDAEGDPAHKQLIPYVVMTCHGKLLSYVRGQRAGETRLVGHRSIGVGGHINPTDDLPLFSNDFREAYRTAVEREVAEEVNVEAAHTDSIVALLNDDSTEVGRVHLGIVHLWRLDAPTVTRREQMMTRMGFASPSALQEDRAALESWSALSLDHFDEMLERAADGETSAGIRAALTPPGD